MHRTTAPVILATALLAACQASPTGSARTTQAGAPSHDGFTMGSGNVVQTPPPSGTDSVTQRGGFTMGSGN
jgi:uncharacterized lipoprotein YajG